MLFELAAGMLERTFFKQIIAYAFAAACVYSIVVFFYIRQMSYEDSFLLYIGNFLFAAVIGIFVAWFYKKHETAVSSIRLVVIGAKAAVAGVVLACLIILLLLLILVPSIFKAETVSHIQLQHSPGQFDGKNNGFGAILFLNAIIGNLGASFFISLLIPFAVMKNLYGDEKKPKPAAGEENPKKNYPL